MIGYAQPLRAIGQALETLNIQAFEMEPAGDGLFVRGKVLLSTRSPFVEPRNPGILSAMELCYSLRDIERLEEEGRSRRKSSQEVADASSLSQGLRSLGGYLDGKIARLLKVAHEFESFNVEYETSLGSKMKERFSSGDLYDLWVRMYLQRQGRAPIKHHV